MALGVFVAGAYTGTYGGVAMGITDEGYTLQWETKVQAIEKSDVYGEMMIDGVYRGSNWFFQTEFIEYKSGPVSAAFPWGAFGVQGVIGRLMSDVAASMILTDTDSTPAATFPATLTATKTILAPGSSPSAQFNSRLRTMPVRLVMLPVDTGSGVMKNFTTT
jgi:hypothetical protein